MREQSQLQNNWQTIHEMLIVRVLMTWKWIMIMIVRIMRCSLMGRKDPMLCQAI